MKELLYVSVNIGDKEYIRLNDLVKLNKYSYMSLYLKWRRYFNIENIVKVKGKICLEIKDFLEWSENNYDVVMDLKKYIDKDIKIGGIIKKYGLKNIDIIGLIDDKELKEGGFEEKEEVIQFIKKYVKM